MKLTHDLALLAARTAAELDHARLGRAESFEATRALGAELEPVHKTVPGAEYAPIH